MSKLRDAIQFCKTETGIKNKSDQKMNAEAHQKMEHCLIQNYLLKHGMDYFGKRDLIYVDMIGSDDYAREGGDGFI